MEGTKDEIKLNEECEDYLRWLEPVGGQKRTEFFKLSTLLPSNFNGNTTYWVSNYSSKRAESISDDVLAFLSKKKFDLIYKENS